MIKAKDRAVPDDDISEDLRISEEIKIMNCSDVVLASCDVEADEISSLYQVDRSRISVIPLGVDHAFFSPGNRDMARRATGLPISGRMMLFVGRIQPLKGADIATEAFISIAERFPDLFLVMIGGPSGPKGQEVMDQIWRKVNSTGLSDRVYFVAPQRHEILSSYYRAADVSIVPSRTESFGLVALEAAACGVPVVASAVGGLKTLVQHGSSGYLVSNRTYLEFGKFTIRVLENEALAKSLQQEAQSL
jgi:D-inositol-3-phosphate glycosyltransferase